MGINSRHISSFRLLIHLMQFQFRRDPNPMLHIIRMHIRPIPPSSIPRDLALRRAAALVQPCERAVCTPGIRVVVCRGLFEAVGADVAEAFREDDGEERPEGREADADDADAAFSSGPDESVGNDP